MLAAIASVILGVWLAISPALLGYSGSARTSAHLLGPLIATFAGMAISQVTRQARLVNVLLAACLIVAPVALGYALIASINSVTVGAILAALSLSRGRRPHAQGGGWTALREHQGP
jgi:hypothetical protein